MSVRADTWMPLYIGDYLADTMHLSGAQHGAYLLLIMHYWRNGPLPNDQTLLAAIARTDRKAWETTIGPVVRAFFDNQGRCLHHKRIDKEIANAETMTEQRRAAGRASADARKRQHEANENPTTVDIPLGVPLQQNGRPSPSPSQEAAATSLIQEEAAPEKPAVNGHRHGARHMPTLDSPWSAWEWLTNGEVEITGANAERRPCAGGFYLDHVAREVCDAAGIDGHAGGIDWAPLVTWLRAGIPGDVIAAAIKKVAGREGYEPKKRLTYFDKPVREAAGKPTP